MQYVLEPWKELPKLAEGCARAMARAARTSPLFVPLGRSPPQLGNPMVVVGKWANYPAVALAAHFLYLVMVACFYSCVGLGCVFRVHAQKLYASVFVVGIRRPTRALRFLNGADRG